MSEHATHHEHGGHPAGALHEENTVQLTPIIIFAIVMVVVSVATFLTVKIIQHAFDINWARSEPPVSALADAQMPMTTPLLQVYSGQDLVALRAKEQAALQSYRWIDKEKGVVAIPIEEAVKLTAQRGLPSREQAKTD